MSGIRQIRAQPWLAFVVASIAMIAFGPRIPLDVFVPGRTFDLRVTDLALAVALPIWLRQHAREALRVPVARIITVYLAIAMVATLLAIGIGGLNASRGVFYAGKEVEYYLLFFIVATTTKTHRQVGSVVLAFQVVASVSVIWFAYQLAVQHDQSLLSLEQFLPTGAYVSPSRGESYGPHLLGESSPFSAGGFFMLAFILNASLMLIRRGKSFLGHAAFASGLLACLALTQSRITLVAAVIAVIAVLAFVLSTKTRRWRPIGGLLVVTIFGLVLSSGLAYLHLSQELPAGTANPESVGVARRLAPSAIEYAIVQRIDIWLPLVEAVGRKPLTGYGKGSIGAIEGLGAGEAHNYYLRIAVETGLPGLASFVAILIDLGVTCYRALRSRRHQTAYVWAWCLGTTSAMAISGLLQDAFVPVILAELFWIAAGLAIAAASPGLDATQVRACGTANRPARATDHLNRASRTPSTLMPRICRRMPRPIL